MAQIRIGDVMAVRYTGSHVRVKSLYALGHCEVAHVETVCELKMDWVEPISNLETIKGSEENARRS